MKSPLLFFILFLSTITVLGQVKMNITLNSGNIRSGEYKIKDMTLGWATKTKIISKKTKEKYNLEDIKSLVMYTETDSVSYEVIQVKKYLDSKKAKLKLGQIGFKGNRIALFCVSEYIYQGGAMPLTTVAPYHEKYLKKKDEGVAYNLGYLYGAGQRGIKKRLRDFFRDCPELIQKVEKNEIPKKETLEIALFYENNCHK